MARTPVALVVGGQTYKIVANVPEDTLRHYAAVVDERIRELVPPGKPVPPTAILLAAVALAHDLDEERAQRQASDARSRDVLRRLLARIDDALETPDAPDATDDTSESAPLPPAVV
jgi:cell division protein ZapA